MHTRSISKRLYTKTRGPNCMLYGLLEHPNTEIYTYNNNNNNNNDLLEKDGGAKNCIYND